MANIIDVRREQIRQEYFQTQQDYRVMVGLSDLVATVSTVALFVLTIYSMTYVPPLAAFVLALVVVPVIFRGIYKTITILKAHPAEMQPESPCVARARIIFGLFTASMLFITLVGSTLFVTPGISAGFYVSRIGLLAGFSVLHLSHGLLSQKMNRLNKELGSG